MTDFLIQFTTDLNPNFGLSQWPKYDFAFRNLMTFLDGIFRQRIDDRYREEAMNYLTSICLEYPF